MTPRTVSEADPGENWPDDSSGGIDVLIFTPAPTDIGAASPGSLGLTCKSNPHHDGKYLIYDNARGRVLTCHDGNLRLEWMNLGKP